MSNPYWSSINPLYIPDTASAFECKDVFSPVQPNSNAYYFYPGAAAACGITLGIGTRFCVWVTDIRFSAFCNNTPLDFNVDIMMGMWDTTVNSFWTNGYLAHIQPFGVSADAFIGNLGVQNGVRSTFECRRGVEFPLLIGGGVPPTLPNDTYVLCPVLRFEGANGTSITYDYIIRGFIAQTGPY